MTTPRGMRGSFARSSSRAAPSPSPTRTPTPLHIGAFSSPARNAATPAHGAADGLRINAWAEQGGGASAGPIAPPTPSGSQARRERINVYVRPRPLQANAAADSDCFGGDHMQLEVRPDFDGRGVSVVSPSGEVLKRMACDGSFAPHASQAHVYQQVGRRFVDALVHKGWNGCIFAYGQTGSGKTWTTFGSGDKGDVDRGLIPRLLDEVFAELEESETTSGGTRSFNVTVEFVEIYNEAIKDLLAAGAAASPTNAQGAQGGSAPRALEIVTIGKRVHVPGLSKVSVQNSSQAMRLLHQGQAARSTAATSMNATSSRSHSVFTLTVECSDSGSGSGAPGDASLRTAKLNLVDLAGSESQKSVATEGLVRKEGNKINQSLSTLSHVIQELAEGKSMPSYRNSKLTHLLRESLGGNSITTLIATINTSVRHQSHTLSTLAFAERAQGVRFEVRANVGSLAQNMDPQAMRKRLDEIVRENQKLKTQNQMLLAGASGGGAHASVGGWSSNSGIAGVLIDPRDAARKLEQDVAFIESYVGALDAKERLLQDAQSTCTELAVERDDLAEQLDALKATLLHHTSALPSAGVGASAAYSATMPPQLNKWASAISLQAQDEDTAVHMEEVHRLEQEKRELRQKVAALEQRAGESAELIAALEELEARQQALIEQRDGAVAALQNELAEALKELEVQKSERVLDAEESNGMMLEQLKELEIAESRAAALCHSNVELSAQIAKMEAEGLHDGSHLAEENRRLARREKELEAQVAELHARLVAEQVGSPHKQRDGAARTKTTAAARASVTPLQQHQAQASALLSSPLSPIHGAVRATRLSALFDSEKAGRRSLMLQSPAAAVHADADAVFHSPALMRAPAPLDENAEPAASTPPHSAKHGASSTRHFSMSPVFYAPEPHGLQLQSPRPLQALSPHAHLQQGRPSFHLR